MSVLERLARAGHRAAIAVRDAWNPDQERDDHGMWSASGSGAAAAASEKAYSSKGSSYERTQEHTRASQAHGDARREAERASNQAYLLGKSREPYEKAAQYHKQREEEHANASKIAFKETFKKPMVSSGNDPRVASAKEEDAREARELARGDRVPLKQGPTQAGGYRGNPAAEGSRAVKQDDYAREKASTLRTTQVEMPAVKEAPVALMAPHSQLPVGNTKPKEPIHDLKTTQKLEAVRDIRVERMMTEEERNAPRQDLSQLNVPDVSQAVKERMGGNKPRVTAAELEARGEPNPFNARLNGRAGTTKESRRVAAAASAGRWASRALENAVKKPLERTGEREHRAFVAMMQSTKSLRQEGYARRGASLSDKQIKDRMTWLRRQEMKGKK